MYVLSGYLLIVLMYVCTAAADALRRKENESRAAQQAQTDAASVKRRALAEQLQGFTGFTLDFCMKALEANGDNMDAAAEWAMLNPPADPAPGTAPPADDTSGDHEASPAVYIEGAALKYQDDCMHSIGGRYVANNPHYIKQRADIHKIRVGQRVAIVDDAVDLVRASWFCTWQDGMNQVCIHRLFRDF